MKLRLKTDQLEEDIVFDQYQNKTVCLCADCKKRLSRVLFPKTVEKAAPDKQCSVMGCQKDAQYSVTFTGDNIEEFDYSPKETAQNWEEICAIYRRTNHPVIAYREMEATLGRYATLEALAVIAEMKKHDGRIYGKDREFVSGIKHNPASSVIAHGNAVFDCGKLDEIHPAYIGQLIQVARTMFAPITELTVGEYNAVSEYTSAIKLADYGFDIFRDDEEEADFFRDEEEGKDLSIREGLKILVEAMAYHPEHDLPREAAQVLIHLLERTGLLTSSELEGMEK